MTPRRGGEMPKVNVYLPDELAAAVREAQIPVSAVCQSALERAVRDVTAARETDALPTRDAPQGMFRNFTQRAYAALVLAEQNARSHGSAAIEPAHILLGVLDEGGNLAVRVLDALDVDPADIRAELGGSMAAATSGPHADRLPLSADSKAVLEATQIEACGLGHGYVGCEHLLLALVADRSLAGSVLRRMGLELRTTRRAVTTALAGFVHARANATQPKRTHDDALVRILQRLEAIEARLG